MPAIPTEYDGIKYRSRTEAKWALYFDLIGLEYEYEPQAFQLEDGLYYIPDFYIPCFGWVEIKGGEPTEEEVDKIRKLVKDTGREASIFSGPPTLLGSDGMKGFPSWYLEDGEVKMSSELMFHDYSLRKWGTADYCGSYVAIIDDETVEKVKKANSYDFERKKYIGGRL